MPLAQEPLQRLLELIAERTPAPGGGSAAACAVAIAAALAQMAAAFMPAAGADARHDEPAREAHEAQEAQELHTRAQEAQELHARAGELRAGALQLADRELHAYAGLLEALRLPADAPGREQRIAAGRAEAIASPLELCRRAADTAELGTELARAGNRNLTGDAICGTLLAEAACQAAAMLVQLNLADAGDERSAGEAGALARRAQEARRLVLSQDQRPPSQDQRPPSPGAMRGTRGR